MSTPALSGAARSAFYRDDEPVIQSHPLLSGAIVPRFGDTRCWDFNGVVHKSPSHPPAMFRVLLHDLPPVWNLMARELAMLWLNPCHPAILAAGVHLRSVPLSAMTVAQRIGHLRSLAAFGAENGLPTTPHAWPDGTFQTYIRHCAQKFKASTVCSHVHLVKALHRFGAALTCAGLPGDPWPGVSTNAVANHPIVAPLRTPAIPPDIWFPLVRNCWTYIDVFAPDIMRATATWADLKNRPPTGRGVGEERFQAWLNDPTSTVPLRRPRSGEGPNPVPHRRMLASILGVSPSFFQSDNPHGPRRTAAVDRLAAAGRAHPGLLADPAEVCRSDGSRGSWHDSLGSRELWLEQVALRSACYVFTAALSMMRDSELRQITKGAVVEFYGSPAVKSTKQKLDAALPVKHWWITPPVARALEIAAQLSQHETLTFAAVTGKRTGDGFTSIAAIVDLIDHMNRWRHVSGLEAIPHGKVTPHMFRRTMAMLTREQPGAEIAVGMQLKHVTTRALANRITSSYMTDDPSWARHLTTAIDDRRLDRLTELFDADAGGQSLGTGPGADRLREAFTAVRDQAELLRATGQARRGDLRVERDLLRRTQISIRFGKLNHCTMNDADPSGAKCLEDAIVPDGHRGPLLDRCQPGRCANSIIAPAHLPIWNAEQSSLHRLLDTGTLAANHRRSIEAQLKEVDRVLDRSTR